MNISEYLKAVYAQSTPAHERVNLVNADIICRNVTVNDYPLLACMLWFGPTELPPVQGLRGCTYTGTVTCPHCKVAMTLLPLDYPWQKSQPASVVMLEFCKQLIVRGYVNDTHWFPK